MKEIIRVESITRVHDFFGLEKPKHPLISVVRNYQSWEEIDFQNNRFVIDLYQVSLKNFKDGSFTYGRNSYDFQEGTLVMTAPGQAIEMEQQLLSLS